MRAFLRAYGYVLRETYGLAIVVLPLVLFCLLVAIPATAVDYWRGE